MDVLAVTLWLLGIVISHLLLRRVVEIDNMNKKLLKEKKQPQVKEVKVEVEKESSDEDLQKELMEYVQSQEYTLPKVDVEFETPPAPMMMSNMVHNNLKPMDMDHLNIVQEFKEERDLNSGSFGNLQAYEDMGFASI